ncbi:MAG: dTDP-glucose 4,6-dehydratase [Nanoarchaeota archaeon]
MRIVITGAAGFIGSNFVRYWAGKYPNYEFLVIDKLTYSGNINNIKDLLSRDNFEFVNGDICNYELMLHLIKENDIIVNFAAESHVDNSIIDSGIFIKTNILGTHSILEAARVKKARLFIQISTDEVYGSLDFDSSSSKENDLLMPSSPYSASKAAAEQICLANFKTFNQPIIVTRSSNNFGPYQFPEKVMPLFITNLIQGKKVPLYGSGKNIRDWIYVEDNCEAIDAIINNGKVGEIYNIGGGNEISNMELTKSIIGKLNKDDSFINYVEDRKGHDLRYSLDFSKIKSLGWKPKFNFEQALEQTIEWYKKNEQWWLSLKNLQDRRTT